MAVFASVFAFTNAQTGVIGGNQNNDATKEKVMRVFLLGPYPTTSAILSKDKLQPTNFSSKTTVPNP